MQVQARIQFITDYHRHGHQPGGTKHLITLTPAKRHNFLTTCLEKLHGGRLAEFVELTNGPLFRPILDIPPGQAHPSPQSIHDAIKVAIGAYNELDFGYQFSTELGHELASAADPFPPPDCIQWWWENGVKVYRYNWDGLLTAGTPPVEGPLTGSYRLSLIYS